MTSSAHEAALTEEPDPTVAGAAMTGSGPLGDSPPVQTVPAPPVQTTPAPPVQTTPAPPVQPIPTPIAHEYPFVYAIGRIEHRYPTLGVEKELAQAIGRTDSNGIGDRRAVYETLRQHPYLARQMCYVMVIGGLETYLVRPRHPADADLLVEAVRPVDSPDDLDTVIGTRGPIAPPEACNGLMVPTVIFDQLYSFDQRALRESIPRPKGIAAKDFEEAVGNVLARILQVTDNAGATDEDRALNYLALRYERIYSATAEAYARNASLASIEVRRASAATGRSLMDVIFAYTDRQTDVTEKLAARVDVTEMFPFLVTKLSPYTDRLS